MKFVKFIKRIFGYTPAYTYTIDVSPIVTFTATTGDDLSEYWVQHKSGKRYKVEPGTPLTINTDTGEICDEWPDIIF